MPKISVILPIYNAEMFLAEAIDSVLSQKYSDFELIIIDDGSIDSSSEIIKRYSDTRIKYRYVGKIGITKALNVGLSMAGGEYVARMDADDISAPDRFSRQVALLKGNPNYAAVGCWWKLISSTGSILDEITVPVEAEEIKRRFLWSAPIPHPAAMFRRDALVSIGGYDESYEYAQDRDLFLRLLARWQLGVVPEFLFFSRVNPNSITLLKETEQKKCSIRAVERAILSGVFPKYWLIFVMYKKVLLFLPQPIINIKNALMRRLGFRHE